MSSRTAIAMFSDRHMLPGLHTTIFSFSQSLDVSTRESFHLFLFLSGVSEKHKRLLRETHELGASKVELHIKDFTPAQPPGGGLLHGNAMAYGRIYLAELLDEFDYCIYLDSDLLVNCSIHELIEFLDKGHIIAADGGAKRSESIDSDLFQEAGLDMNGNCFNSGVLCINLRSWRENGIGEVCNDISSRFGSKFRSADQSLLNVVFGDDFFSFGDRFNSKVYPTSEPLGRLESKIYHFVGSPKPWDPFGKFTSSNYDLWKQIYRKTGSRDFPLWRFSTLDRSVRLLRSYGRSLQTK